MPQNERVTDTADRRRRIQQHRIGAAAALSLLGISGCSATASVEAAPEAHDPACAEVMLSLPEAVGDYEQRPTSSQGTSAWGDPSAVVMRCGVVPPGPTEHPCVAPAGVDWVWIEHDDYSQLVTYGREPAVELLIDQEFIDESTMMNVQAALSSPVSQIPQTRECVAPDQATS